jgi:hypothetical protein
MGTIIRESAFGAGGGAVTSELHRGGCSPVATEAGLGEWSDPVTVRKGQPASSGACPRRKISAISLGRHVHNWLN